MLVSKINSRDLYGRGDAELLLVDSPLCYAVVAIQGGQLLEFQPTGEKPVLWLSPLAPLADGKPIRGGVPICAPWFGPHPSDEDKPKHGFARIRDWDVMGVRDNADGQVYLQLGYRSKRYDKLLYPQEFAVRVEMMLGTTAKLRFSLKNLSEDVIDVSWAMHSYFAVADVRQTQVHGLNPLLFRDATDNYVSKEEQGPVAFEGEVDRVYHNVMADAVIDDGQRRIQVSGTNSPTVVVWNPGDELANDMADIKGHYPEFVCVERGQAVDERQQLASEGVALGEMEIAIGS